MKLGWICPLLVLLASSRAYAQFGPPQPRAPSQGYSFGVGLQNVQSRWTYDFTIARNRVYFEGSHGLSEYLEVFSRIGGSEWVINDIETLRPGLTHDVSSDGYPAFLSAGLRGSPLVWGSWSIGFSFETAVYSGMDRTIRWTFDSYQELHFDPTVEINGAISFGHDCAGGIFYLGPLIHLGYASADIRTHTFGEDWSVQDSIDALTIRDKPGWGCFVGWLRPLSESGWNLQLEGSALRGGFGGAISCFKAW